MAGCTAAELVKMIYDDNDDISAAFGPSFLDDVKVVSRKKYRNNNNIFRRLMHKGQIFLNMTVVYVEEANKVTICHNCHTVPRR